VNFFMGKQVKVNRFTFTHPPTVSNRRFDIWLYKLKGKQKKAPKVERLNLEEILSSACRRKIIKYLAENGSVNIMRLIVGVNGKYPQVNAELQILQKEGIISDQHIGRTRLIGLVKENSGTILILQALKILTDRKRG